MIAGMLHGMLVIWRSRNDKEAIMDWGIFQNPLEPHPAGYSPDIICEARVPIYSTGDVVLKKDMELAREALTKTIIHDVQTRSDLARIRAQFGHVKEHGKPKPGVEVMEEHEWQQMMAAGGLINQL